MRILSQDGNIDVPYEQLGLTMFFNEIFSGNWDINANIGGNKAYKMAEYSTEAKARKAMEMLRETYSPKIEIKEPFQKEIPELRSGDWVLTVAEPKVEVMDNFYFQFPADDEVEA